LTRKLVVLAQMLEGIGDVGFAANVLQLGEVAEIEAQMFSFAQKLYRRIELEFGTEPAILPNCCYHQCFFTFRYFNFDFIFFVK
jgi:hypothetical protein